MYKDLRQRLSDIENQIKVLQLERNEITTRIADLSAPGKLLGYLNDFESKLGRAATTKDLTLGIELHIGLKKLREEYDRLVTNKIGTPEDHSLIGNRLKGLAKRLLLEVFQLEPPQTEVNLSQESTQNEPDSAASGTDEARGST